MKKLQYSIGLPSGILLLVSLLLSYNPGLIVALGGIFLSLVCRQIRLHKHSYKLGHPDRHADKDGYGFRDDHLEEAETYEQDKRV